MEYQENGVSDMDLPSCPLKRTAYMNSGEDRSKDSGRCEDGATGDTLDGNSRRSNRKPRPTYKIRAEEDEEETVKTKENKRRIEVKKKSFPAKVQSAAPVRGFLTHPYMCCLCGDTFAKPSQLKSHVDDHSGEKPHECPVCKEKFKRKVDLKKHKSVHIEKELED